MFTYYYFIRTKQPGNFGFSVLHSLCSPFFMFSILYVLHSSKYWTGQENNVAQPKPDKWFSFSLNFFIVFDRLAVFYVLFCSLTKGITPREKKWVCFDLINNVLLNLLLGSCFTTLAVVLVSDFFFFFSFLFPFFLSFFLLFFSFSWLIRFSHVSCTELFHFKCSHLANFQGCIG